MHEKILNDLKNKIYSPIYFLMGEESYYIDQITKYIMDNVLTEQEKTFNQVVLYGKDVDIAAVINNAKRYPMMANYQVVIVKEAQHIKNIDDLIYYVQSPLKTTLLVINYKYKTLDKRKKLYKELDKKSVLFDSKKIYDDKLPAWIAQYLKTKKCAIEPAASLLLAENLGNDLSKISNELDKLAITLPEGQNTITAGHIEKMIGISKDFNNFELQKALQMKDALKSNRIINYFAKNPNQNPITLTITSLYFFFSKVLLYHFLKDKSNQGAAAALKINPYFIKDYQMAARNYPIPKAVETISLLREYDLKSKGVGSANVSHGDLLKELVFKILH